LLAESQYASEIDGAAAEGEKRGQPGKLELGTDANYIPKNHFLSGGEGLNWGHAP